jgi:DNA-binding NtrC family response regulator
MAEATHTLLIVDDEEPIHRSLERTLRKEPYALLHAHDAAEAWLLLRQHPEIDLVVCDHYMPGTHGLDFLMRVRQRYPDLVTVLLTAQADLELVIRAINQGHVHRFFTKPWDAARLRSELAALLAGGVPAEEATSGAHVSERLREELLPRTDDHGAFIIEDPTA